MPGQTSSRKVSPQNSAARGTIEGRILFDGPQTPASTRVQNTTDPAQCGRVQSLRNIMISKQGGIENAIITLAGVPAPAESEADSTRLLLHNRDCQFEPHVAVLTTGSIVETANDDPVTHTVHLYGLFHVNVALGPRQTRFVKRLERPGLYVVKCDLHGWMQAYLRVDDHPFHDVSDPAGAFRIHNIPEGSYTLEVWHEYFGTQRQHVRVTGGQVTRVKMGYDDPSLRPK